MENELVKRLADATLRLIGFMENHIDFHSTMMQTSYRALQPIKQEFEEILTLSENANESRDSIGQH